MMDQHKVYVNRTFACPAEELYKYLTQPNLFAQWFGPKKLTVGQAQMDVQIGGSYDIQMMHPDGTHFFIHGQYLDMIPARSLRFSMNYRGANMSPPPSIIDIRFTALGPDTTELSLTQGFDKMPTDYAERTVVWGNMLALLAQLVQE